MVIRAKSWADHHPSLFSSRLRRITGSADSSPSDARSTASFTSCAHSRSRFASSGHRLAGISFGTLSPPFSLVFVVPRVGQDGLDQQVGKAAQLVEVGVSRFCVLLLYSPRRPFCLSSTSLLRVRPSGDLPQDAATDVLSDHPSICPAAAGVVTRAPLSRL